MINTNVLNFCLTNEVEVDTLELFSTEDRYKVKGVDILPLLLS